MNLAGIDHALELLAQLDEHVDQMQGVVERDVPIIACRAGS